MRLFRPHVPSVFTAHDLLPRRTARKQDLWRDLLATLRPRRRAQRARPRDARGARRRRARHPPPRLPERPGAPRRRAHRARVRRHPPVQGPRRRDRGGAARPTRGSLVAGDPLEPMEPYRAAARGVDVDWRLGYLPQAEVDRALGEATLAVFPYKPELDQSGALLRALGAGVPAVAYDVGGVAEPVRALRRRPRRPRRRRRGARRRDPRAARRSRTRSRPRAPARGARARS